MPACRYAKPELLKRTVDGRINGSIETNAAQCSFSEKGPCTFRGIVALSSPK